MAQGLNHDTMSVLASDYNDKYLKSDLFKHLCVCVVLPLSFCLPL